MTIAYFDCFAGASGDMLVGALLDAGVDPEAWRRELDELALPDPYELTVQSVRKQGFAATKMTVWLGGRPADSEPMPGVTPAIHAHDHGAHDHAPSHDHGHEHGHDHEHEAHGHEHAHRSLREILHLLEHSPLSAADISLASRIFKTLGEAEAKVHGVPVSEIHFHEVGAVDAILDVVGFAIAYRMLGITEAVVSPLVTGSGLVRCAHGTMPIPVPAVLELLQRSGAPTQDSPVTGEALTPTGAAILTTIASRYGAMPAMERITRTGYGAGSREGKIVPNLVRVVLGEAAGNPSDER